MEVFRVRGSPIRSTYSSAVAAGSGVVCLFFIRVGRIDYWNRRRGIVIVSARWTLASRRGSRFDVLLI